MVKNPFFGHKAIIKNLKWIGKPNNSTSGSNKMTRPAIFIDNNTKEFFFFTYMSIYSNRPAKILAKNYNEAKKHVYGEYHNSKQKDYIVILDPSKDPVNHFSFIVASRILSIDKLKNVDLKKMTRFSDKTMKQIMKAYTKAEMNGDVKEIRHEFSNGIF